MKSFRQSAILDIVERESVTSQGQLRALLHLQGIDATQATLSRDIRDLGLIKRAVDGAYRTAGDADGAGGDPAEDLQTAVADYLRRVDAVEQLLVLKTDVGMAQPLALAIDRARVHEIVGTIGGDDTILVICRSARDAATVAARLEEWRAEG
jgi:transcriptional regulator of arginine metabolism